MTIGPRGNRNWLDDGPVQPPEPGKPTILPWILAALVVLIAALAIGGAR